MVYLILLISTICAATGQIFLKKGAEKISQFSDVLNFDLFLGTTLYAISFLLWVFSLSKVQLSVVYGFTLLTFILVFVFSHFMLQEKISYLSMIGILVVFVGFLMIFLGENNQT